MTLVKNIHHDTETTDMVADLLEAAGLIEEFIDWVNIVRDDPEVSRVMNYEMFFTMLDIQKRSQKYYNHMAWGS